MKLLYTEMSEDMTAILTKEAKELVAKGYRVFYIAPNALSFEKEKKVLSYLPERASFGITVTRFAQMIRYFTLKTPQKTGIDELGLSLVTYQVLSDLNPDSLKAYGRLQKDSHFIKQIVKLYQELQKSQLAVADLAHLSDKKGADLLLILSALEERLHHLNRGLESPLERLQSAIRAGQVEQDLSRVVVILDGFTRLTAQEEALLDLLHRHCHQIIIGTYATPSAYHAQYLEGNLYEASCRFLRDLASTYGTKPSYIEPVAIRDQQAVLTEVVVSHYALGQDPKDLPAGDYPLAIWEANTAKEELEAVARNIRQKLFEGYRYKDILLLLGDVEGYQLHLRQTFQRYGIPYYLGQPESMAHHPLVHLMEALERLFRYSFRGEDLLTLIKTGFYGHLTWEELDLFEQYVTFADVKGFKTFTKPFKINQDQRFDLETLNQIRDKVMAPLEAFYQTKAQAISDWLKALLGLLQTLDITGHLEDLAQADNEAAERQGEVWKAFCQILESLEDLVAKEELNLVDFMSLLVTGLQTADYRIIPATVDVVMVKDFDMIEPHTNKLVYAIGLSQANFPKLSKNQSLLTDEERARLNADLTEGRLDIVSQENLKRNNYTFISLLHAAEDFLVLSSPRLSQEAEASRSTYLTGLLDLGLPLTQVNLTARAVTEDLESYYGLLSRLITFYQMEEELTLTKEEQTFWSVALRKLRKRLAKEGLSLPEVADELSTKPLSQEVLAARYPEEVLQLSASSLTTFYDNEYGYFLRQVLALEEPLTLKPDARHYGNFLHRVFELVMATDEGDFDQRLNQAIATTKAEADNQQVYEQSARTRYTQEVLEDIARATALVLRDNPAVKTLAEEVSFGTGNSNLLELPDGRKINIRGKIDRLDRLTDQPSYGVVDYKSSDKTFKLADFYNKLTPQLVTYLAALQNDPKFEEVASVFGAMYLHMQEPEVDLKQVTSRDEVLTQAHRELQYKGLFLADTTNRLNQAYASKNTFTAEELSVLLAYNAKLYRDAAERILSGHFAINPYTKDDKTVLGQQFKAITGFEANRHLSQARKLLTFPRKEQTKTILTQMRGELDHDL